MTTLVPSLCFLCKHLHEEEDPPWKCEAFPGGIPAQILEWTVDHRKPVAGDHEIRFELAPGKSQAYVDFLVKLMGFDV